MLSLGETLVDSWWSALSLRPTHTEGISSPRSRSCAGQHWSNTSLPSWRTLQRAVSSGTGHFSACWRSDKGLGPLTWLPRLRIRCHRWCRWCWICSRRSSIACFSGPPGLSTNLTCTVLPTSWSLKIERQSQAHSSSLFSRGWRPEWIHRLQALVGSAAGSVQVSLWIASHL